MMQSRVVGGGGKEACALGANCKECQKVQYTNTPYSNILQKYTLFQILNHALHRRFEKLVILVE